MATVAPRRGQIFMKRRSGAYREVIGFTTKPDGIRRARLADLDTGRETKVVVDQLPKSYQSVDY